MSDNYFEFTPKIIRNLFSLELEVFGLSYAFRSEDTNEYLLSEHKQNTFRRWCPPISQGVV